MKLYLKNYNQGKDLSGNVRFDDVVFGNIRKGKVFNDIDEI